MSHFTNKVVGAQRGEKARTKDEWLEKGRAGLFHQDPPIWSWWQVVPCFWVIFVHICVPIVVLRDFGNGGHRKEMM